MTAVVGAGPDTRGLLDHDTTVADLANTTALLRRQIDALRPASLPPPGRNVLALPFYWTTDRVRAGVTRKVFTHYRRVADRLGLAVVGVGSEGDTSRNLWCDYFDPADYHEYPQPWTGKTPGAGSVGLRAKFDETVRAALRFNPDRVFVGGSDDVITFPFFERAFASSADLVGIASGSPQAVKLVRLARNEIVCWDGLYRWAPDVTMCGGGLVLSRALLDEWDFAPFSEDGDEVGIERRARAAGATIDALCPERVGFDFWAVKTERTVLNDWRQVQRVKTSRADPATRDRFQIMWAGL